MAVFAAASRKIPDGAPGGTAACFAAIDSAIAAALVVERNAEREACAKAAEAAASEIRAAEFVGPREAAEALRDVAATMRARK